MTEAELQAIRVRLDAATPGRWSRMFASPDLETCRYIFADTTPGDGDEWDWGGDDGAYPTIVMAPAQGGNWEEDAAFIAHAREDIPNLIREIETLQGIIHDMEQDSDAHWRGVQEERRRTADLIRSHQELWKRQSTFKRLAVGPVRGLERLAEDLARPEPVHAGPDELRLENRRLRLALQEAMKGPFDSAIEAMVRKAGEGKSHDE